LRMLKGVPQRELTVIEIADLTPVQLYVLLEHQEIQEVGRIWLEW